VEKQDAKKWREKNKILEPALWAAQLLINDLQKGKEKEVYIADFGCGELHFAKHVIIEAIKNKQNLGQKIINICCFDLADRIDLIDLGGQHIISELELMRPDDLLQDVTISLSSENLLPSDGMISKFNNLVKGKKRLESVEIFLKDEVSFKQRNMHELAATLQVKRIA